LLSPGFVKSVKPIEKREKREFNLTDFVSL
jgi:hypothetical protein